MRRDGRYKGGTGNERRINFRGVESWAGEYSLTSPLNGKTKFFLFISCGSKKSSNASNSLVYFCAVEGSANRRESISNATKFSTVTGEIQTYQSWSGSFISRTFLFLIVQMPKTTLATMRHSSRKTCHPLHKAHHNVLLRHVACVAALFYQIYTPLWMAQFFVNYMHNQI